MKTFTAKPETVKRDWYVVDADGKTLGRLATELARRLRGKHKAEYTPHVDTGDYIIVLNADKVAVTGNSVQTKCTTTTPATSVVSSKRPLKR
jgi:large subunit ribosomal protein L13